MSGLTVQPLRFGWHSEVHGAIESGARSTLSPSWFKDYVQGHKADIQFHDDNQDANFRGPGHFINWGARNNNHGSLGKGGNVWNQVQNYFTHKQRRKDQGMFRDLNQVRSFMPQGLTVVQSILNNYNQVKASLVQVLKAGVLNNPDPTAEQQKALDGLNKSVGQLGHYVGDFYMPLHNTVYYNWTAFGKDIHTMIDGHIFQSADHQWLSEHPEAPDQPITEQSLPDFLLHQLGKNHLAIFDIVEAQKQVGFQTRNFGYNKNALRDLKDALRPIAFPQVQKAEGTLGALLQLAWDEANRETAQKVPA